MPIHYTVLLEPIASTALFFANDVESVRGRFNGEAGATPYSQRRAYLLRDSFGLGISTLTTIIRGCSMKRVRCCRSPLRRRCAGPGRIIPDSIRETYLQLPALDPRIPELAKQITAGANTPYDKARAIEGYLRSHYGYTLDLSGTPQPIRWPIFCSRSAPGIANISPRR